MAYQHTRYKKIIESSNAGLSEPKSGIELLSFLLVRSSEKQKLLDALGELDILSWDWGMFAQDKLVIKEPASRFSGFKGSRRRLISHSPIAQNKYLSEWYYYDEYLMKKIWNLYNSIMDTPQWQSHSTFARDYHVELSEGITATQLAYAINNFNQIYAHFGDQMSLPDFIHFIDEIDWRAKIHLIDFLSDDLAHQLHQFLKEDINPETFLENPMDGFDQVFNIIRNRRFDIARKETEIWKGYP
jgi:hypothetical protein